MSKQDLIDAFNKFNEKHTFTPGQIVDWKPGMKNKKSNGPFIVMELLESTVTDPCEEAGSPYFREPLDIILGCLQLEGELCCYHFDSRRFQPTE